MKVHRGSGLHPAVTTVVSVLGAGLFTVNAMAQEAASPASRSFVDDTGVSVSVPANPRRIVSLHDHTLTVPLLELGLLPVGSHGRITPDGEPFIRSSLTLTGVDFSNSDITFVGSDPVDMEKVAALDPDLILTTVWQTADVTMLRAIAPTVVFDDGLQGRWGVVEALAELVGRTEQRERMEARYAAQITLIRQMIDTESIMVSTVHTSPDGNLFGYRSYGNLGRVLDDAGFRQPALIEALPDDGEVEFSAEKLQELDGDFLISTYRSSAGDTPENVRSYFDKAVPGFCNLMHACREGQMVLISRAEAFSNSYYALGAVAYMILSEIGGKPFVPRGDQTGTK